MFYAYVLKTSGGTFYTGQTSDLENRINQHKSKGAKCAKYLRKFESFELVYFEEVETRSEALKRELQIKQKSHASKALLKLAH